MPPVSFALWFPALYSRRSARMCRSPWRCDVAAQLCVAVDVGLEVVVVALDGDGFVGRRLFRPGGQWRAAALAVSGQVGSSATAGAIALVSSARPSDTALIESSGTVSRTILIRMLEHDPRLTLIRTWLTRDLGWRVGRITVASADASFRRYFRVSRGDVDPSGWAPKADTLIVMDAPPGKEDIAPYLKVSRCSNRPVRTCPMFMPRTCAVASSSWRIWATRSTYVAANRPRCRPTLRRCPDDARQHPGARMQAAQQLAPYDRAPLERELDLMPEWFLAGISGSNSRPKNARSSPSRLNS